jgi:hypothetical protein
MAGELNEQGGIESLVNKLADDRQLEYWLGPIRDGRVQPEEAMLLTDMAWEQAVLDSGLIPEYAALHGLKEQVLETANSRLELMEAARVQA